MFSDVLEQEQKNLENTYGKKAREEKIAKEQAKAAAAAAKSKKKGKKGAVEPAAVAAPSSSSSNVSFQFVLDACAFVSSEFTNTLPYEIGSASALEASQAVEVENPLNVARRSELEQWKAKVKAAQADTEKWKESGRKMKMQAEKEAADAATRIDGALSAADSSFLSAHAANGTLDAQLHTCYKNMAVKGDASLHALQSMQGFVAAVAADNRVISKRINEEDKKAYGNQVNDAKSIIAELTAAGNDDAAQ